MNKITSFITKIRKLLNFDFNHLSNCQNEILNQLVNINNKLENYNITLHSEISKISQITNSIYKEFDYSNLEMNKLMKGNKNNKKQILICGFYGAINLGDDLMLETLLSYLNNIKNIEITIMLCDKKNIDLTNYGEYNFIHYPTKTDDFNIIAKYFDVVIFGGGALLDDKDYDDDFPIFNLGYILINLSLEFINFNKTTILYGLSSNKKLDNIQYINKLNKIIDKSTVFSLRDVNSLKTLKEAGLNVSKVKIVDDIVLGNELLMNTKKKQNKKIKLGVIYICTDEYYDLLKEYTKEIIDYIKNNKNDYEITFIPFYDHMNNDARIYNKIICDFDNDKLILHKMPKKMQDLINIFEEQDYIISMRYHATLIANFMNKNVLSIDFVNHRHYFNKIHYIYEKYEFERNNITFLEKIGDNNFDLLFKKHKWNDVKDFMLKAEKDIRFYITENIEVKKNEKN